MFRKIATGTAVIAGLLVLSAGPAEAAPGEPGDRGYTGPVTSAMFAGVKVEACGLVTNRDGDVYLLPGEFVCGDGY